MKKIVFFIILIVVLFAVPVTVYMVGQQQELRSRAAPATVLTVNPSTANKTSGDIFSLDIQIDTGVNNVAMAELHLIYDATKLEALSITNGPLAPKIAASGVVGSGTASITVRAESTTQPIKGTGTIAVVRLKAIGSTDSPTQVKFDTTTYVSGLGESNPNVLTNTIPSTITIQGALNVSPSPTASTTVTPTPTGSTTVTPTPTGSTTVVPTLTITPTPTSTASAEATSSAITLNIPKDENGLTSNLPVITGTAQPGSIITIVIYSDPITAVVTANTIGAWQYTPSAPLTDGSHTLTATIQSPSGATTTRSEEFTVASSGIGGAGDAMPNSGTTNYTIFLIGVAILFLVGGVVIQTSQIRL